VSTPPVYSYGTSKTTGYAYNTYTYTVTQVVTTTYVDVNTKGLTTKTGVYTTTYCPGAQTYTPSAVPYGWTTDVTVCNYCGDSPMTLTLTRPVQEHQYGGQQGNQPAQYGGDMGGGSYGNGGSDDSGHQPADVYPGAAETTAAQYYPAGNTEAASPVVLGAASPTATKAYDALSKSSQVSYPTGAVPSYKALPSKVTAGGSILQGGNVLALSCAVILMILFN